MANLRKDFSNLMNRNYLNLNYRTIYNRLQNILRNSNNQEQELKEYVYTLMENIVQQNITFKNRIPTPKELAKRRFPCQPAIKLCMDTIGLFKKMCVEINPEFKSVTYFGLKQEDFSSIVNKEVNKTVMYDSVSEYMQREPYDLLVNDIDGIRKTIDGNTEYNDLSKKDKVILQDMYMKKEMAKQQMSTHGNFWKFFCRKAVKNYNEFIEKTEDLLKRCKFGDEAIHEAINYYSSINDQNDDRGHLKEHFALKKQNEERAKKSKNGVFNRKSINVIRFDNAKNLEEKTHELRNKLSEITSKYPGMAPECGSIGVIRDNCMLYDNTNDKKSFKDISRQIYWNFYKQIVNKQGVENFNIKEAMFDANKLTLLVMNKYTPIYEDPNLVDILPELSFGTMTGETIEKVTKQALPGVEINVKEEAQTIIDEYKALDNVKLDKQSIGIEKEQAIINEEDVNLDNGLISEKINEVIENSNVKVI